MPPHHCSWAGCGVPELSPVTSALFHRALVTCVAINHDILGFLGLLMTSVAECTRL